MNARTISLCFVLPALAALLVSVAASPAAASPRWSEWSAPVWLGATINSTAVDFGPGISKDGLTLYFGSTRPGGMGGEDLWVSYRATTDSPWGPPVNLAPLNTPANDRVPTFSRDGHRMFFARGTPPDIWVSYRLHTHEDFGQLGWQAPMPVSSLNTPYADVAPAYFVDDETGREYLFFASNRPGGFGNFDIYVAAQQPDGSFGDVTNVVALNSPQQDARPTISHDGLEIIFHRIDPLGNIDLWSATRASVGSAWSTPISLVTLNTPDWEAQPVISADGQALYFTSNRPGSLGQDLWVSKRTKETGAP